VLTGLKSRDSGPGQLTLSGPSCGQQASGGADDVPGPPHNGTGWIAERARVLNAHCVAIGRDPVEITHSAQIIVDYADPAATRAHVRALAAAGIRHIVLALPRPYPDHAARWLVDEIVTPVRENDA